MPEWERELARRRLPLEPRRARASDQSLATWRMQRRGVDDRPMLAHRNAREAFTRFVMARPSDGAVWSAVSTRSDSIVHRCPCATCPFHPPDRRCPGGRRHDMTVAARTAPWYRRRSRRCGGTNWVWCLCAIAPRKWSRSDRRTIPSAGDRRDTRAPELDRRNTGDLRYGEPYLVTETVTDPSSDGRRMCAGLTRYRPASTRPGAVALVTMQATARALTSVRRWTIPPLNATAITVMQLRLQTRSAPGFGDKC